MDGQDVIIAGAGAVGVCSAYELGRRGARVLVLDPEPPGRGCSFANAGLIVPSHCMPFASPETLRGAPGWLFDRRSPIRLALRMGPASWRWLRWFLLTSRGPSAARRARALHKLSNASLDLYAGHAEEGLEFGFRRAGWLHIFRQERAFEQAVKEVRHLEAFGVRTERLGPEEVRRMEPVLRPGTVGGWFYPDDAQIDPFAFVQGLAAAAQHHGVNIEQGLEVTGLRVRSGRVVAVETGAGERTADHFVVAAGAKTPAILDALVKNLPLLPGRGSSYTHSGSKRMIRQPLEFVEARVVASPLGDRLRLTTGLDLGDDRPGPVERHLQWLRQAAVAYLDLQLDGELESWGGLRPMSPDGLPLVGPLKNWPNLHLATGHGQLGMTLAPITGRIVASLIAGDGHAWADAFAPARFGI